MDIRDKLLYTKEHEWVLIEGNKGKMGITDYAQHHLGDITYIELPLKGSQVKQFQIMASVESVKAASDIYASMSGEIVEFNGNLESSPEILNKKPYEDGWIAVIQIKDSSEKNNLMDSRKYREYVEGLERNN